MVKRPGLYYLICLNLSGMESVDQLRSIYLADEKRFASEFLSPDGKFVAVVPGAGFEALVSSPRDQFSSVNS